MAYPEAEKALERAKMSLMMRANTSFYTTVLLSLKHEITEKLPTAATNGIWLKVNPNFFLDLTEREQLGLLIHEVLHVCLMHMTRLNGRDPEIWNIAADHCINLMLLKEGYHLPTPRLAATIYEGMSTEEIYKQLYQEAKDSPDSTVPDGIGMDISYPGDDVDETTELLSQEDIQEQVTEIVLRAATQAKMDDTNPGNIHGSIEILLEKTLNPKLPWNIILQNYMSQFSKSDYSFSRPNKRYFPEFYLPTTHAEAICNLAIAVDSSGSVLPEEFSYFINEIAVIQSQLQPEKITLIDFDTEINDIRIITQDTDVLRELEFTGGGGTYVVPVTEWATKNKPDVLLIFSDGEFIIPEEPKGIPIVWLIHNDPSWKCDYGTIIHYELNTN